MKLRDGRIQLSPSDLSNHLACDHLTKLELAVLHGELKKPYIEDPHRDLIFAKGNEHEAAYLARLEARGLSITRIPTYDDPDFDPDEARRLTEEAIRAGNADVVYQPYLASADRSWHGFGDFLERTPAGGYEPVDTKLARTARPAHVLQLMFYAEQVERIQGALVERVHVENGRGERETFRVADYAAYYRSVRERFLASLADDEATYPWPRDHCGRCDFRRLCHQRLVDDDNPVLVAGLSRRYVDPLAAAGITTLADLGASAAGLAVDGIRPERVEALRHQAELQLHHRTTGEHRVDLLPPEAERGFELLPAPDEGDVYLDLEGHAFYEPARGLEYLFGYCYRDDGGATRYEALWARDRDGEREIFERFVDWLTERRRRFPRLHVYHYASYERTALTRLMGEHGTREDAIDALLRGEVLVDLYRIVRQSLRASVPSYSIKEVEKVYGFVRTADVSGGDESTVIFERWLESGDDSLLHEIERYNEEDCRSTVALHQWLLELRPPETPWRAPPEEREVKEEAKERLDERARVVAALLDGAAEGEPRRLLGHLLEYHRREEKPQWWEYFHHRSLEEDELLEDTDTIGGLSLVGEPEEDKQSLVYTFSFPPQEHKIGVEALDPATEKLYTVKVDDEHGLLTLRRAKNRREEPLPRALIPPEPLPTRVQRDAVLRFAKDQARYPALVEILERRPPRARLDAGTVEAAVSLDGSYLFVQGPPGSGKTWRGARMAIALMRQGRRVGVTSLSHKAIHKFLEDVREAALEQGYRFKGRKKSSGDEGTRYKDDFVDCADDNAAMLDDELQLLAGTSFLFSREELAGHVDTLFVDEGGQIALADAIAVGTAARNLVLLGDPNQLAQVSVGSHPPGAEASVLRHLLGEDETLRPGMGLFLEETWRMRPEVNAFVSETFYEGRLESAEETLQRSLAGGNGIRWLPVTHDGNRTQSWEEADAVASEIARLRVPHGDVICVAPYNAQVRALRERVPDAVAVGTVDKFQGQQARVVFYSMASSTGAEAPRGLDFLYSRNRLNVAVSRAQCLAYVVCAPALLDVDCKTVEHMRLANALCRFVELAS